MIELPDLDGGGKKMTGLHYDEDVLIDYLISPDNVEEREEIEQHLSACSTCQSIAEGYQQFSQSLSDSEVWEREEFSSALARADEKKVQEFVSFAVRLQDEQAAANTQLDSLLNVEPAFRGTMIDISPEFWTLGLAQVLCERAYDGIERSPSESLALSELAIRISEKISPQLYPETAVLHIRGRAWKEKALSLRILDRYSEALKALDRAEQCFSQEIISDFDLALVSYERAQVFRELDRLSEALAMARESARVFAQFGHQRRYLRARLVEGNILYRSGDLRRARDLWLDLLKPVQSQQDLETLAMLFNNIGLCSVELGEPDSAGTYLLQAVSIFDELGFRTEALRGRWNIGRLMLSGGRVEEGLSRLRSIHEEFEALEMPEEAGVVGLDVVEGLLRIGQSDEAAVICRYLVEKFSSLKMSSHAITALSYLREAVAAGKATPKLAHHVRMYLAELPKRPQQLFAPPPP